jgi:splicing factor 3B subunit 3
MDFGLNTVKRKSSDVIPDTAHQLLHVPYAPDGPGGVIILCEDFLIYRPNKGTERKVPYPKRISAPHDRGAMITAFGYHKQKDRFFYLI